jgi:hypothetical protein
VCLHQLLSLVGCFLFQRFHFLLEMLAPKIHQSGTGPKGWGSKLKSFKSNILFHFSSSDKSIAKLFQRLQSSQ